MPAYTFLAKRFLSTTFKLPGLPEFTLAEIEVYPDDDPYTHGHPDQLLAGPNKFYFHRASKSPSAKYKGGTYKGLDITFDYKGRVGGVLIRSVISKGAFIEGPCKVVDFLLTESGSENIEDFIRKFGCNASKFMAVSETPPPFISGPRFGLGWPKENEAKRRTFYEGWRFVSTDVFNQLKKGKPLLALASQDPSIVKPSWQQSFNQDLVSLTIQPLNTIDATLAAYGSYLRYGWY